jgi:hypothetical protein
MGTHQISGIIAMRYARCAHIFMAAIVLAATVIFWLKQ